MNSGKIEARSDGNPSVLFDMGTRNLYAFIKGYSESIDEGYEV